MGRRGENIRKRSDGRWEARVIQGYPSNGKTNYKYLYGRSYQEARQKKKDFLTNIKKESDNSELNKQLLSTVTLEWLTLKKTDVKSSTYAYYSFMVHTHILPELGELSLNAIDSEQLKHYLTCKKQHGRIKDGGPLTNKTVFDLKNILMQILRYAKSRGSLTSLPESPVLSARPPAIRVLTKQEQDKIEHTALTEDNPFSLGILLSLYGGLRIGEACALQWKDFDNGCGTINISKTVSRIIDTECASSSKTMITIDNPKTVSSIRTIPLPEYVFQYFLQRRKPNECYVMTGGYKCMEPRVCLDRFKRMLHRSGVRDYSYHALRHTFATRCVENGMDIKSLSEIMGHSDVKITMQRYVHPSMDSKKAQINKLPCFTVNSQNSRQKDS